MNNKYQGALVIYGNGSPQTTTISLYKEVEAMGYRWDSRSREWIPAQKPEDATPTKVIQMRIVGTLIEARETIEKLKTQFDVIKVSDPYLNRADDNFRFYLTVRL